MRFLDSNIKFESKERRCVLSRREIERIHGETAANVQASLAVGSAGRSCEIVLRGVSREGGAAGREKFGDLVEEWQQRHVAQSRKDRPAQSVQVKFSTLSIISNSASSTYRPVYTLIVRSIKESESRGSIELLIKRHLPVLEFGFDPKDARAYIYIHSSWIG